MSKYAQQRKFMTTRTKTGYIIDYILSKRMKVWSPSAASDRREGYSLSMGRILG